MREGGGVFAGHYGTLSRFACGGATHKSLHEQSN